MVLQRCNHLFCAVIVTTSETVNECLLWACSRCRFSEYRSLLCLSSSFRCAILGRLSFYRYSLSVEDGILVSIFFVIPFHTNIHVSQSHLTSTPWILFPFLGFLLDEDTANLTCCCHIWSFPWWFRFFLCELFFFWHCHFQQLGYFHSSCALEFTVLSSYLNIDDVWGWS